MEAAERMLEFANLDRYGHEHEKPVGAAPIFQLVLNMTVDQAFDLIVRTLRIFLYRNAKIRTASRSLRSITQAARGKPGGICACAAQMGRCKGQP
jgi:hypothetical protein